MRSWSDREGRVAYRLSPGGRECIDSPTLPPADLPGYDEDAANAYDEAVEHARGELANATPMRGETSIIPLSCGLWPPDAARAPIPYCLTMKGEPRSLQNMVAGILKDVERQKRAAKKAR